MRHEKKPIKWVLGARSLGDIATTGGHGILLLSSIKLDSSP